MCSAFAYDDRAYRQDEIPAITGVHVDFHIDEMRVDAVDRG